MVKKIIIGCMILMFAVTGILLSSRKEQKKVAKQEVSIVEQTKKKYYVQNVPKVNQEYTIGVSNVVNNDVGVALQEMVDNGVEVIEEENKNNEEVDKQDNITKDEGEKEPVKNVIEVNPEEETVQESNDNSDGEKQEESGEAIDITEEIKVDNSNVEESKEPTNEQAPVLKNGFVTENETTYYYENDIKVTGLKSINGVNNYFSPSGKYLGTNNIKVIDVSYYQKDIDWDRFASESDCYGVILRLGYWKTLDKKFERNISELKRLNIPYGIYLFSYSTTLNGAKTESDFTNNMIDKYDLNPTLGIYYDIESWSTKNSSSNGITKSRYDEIVQLYVNSVSNHVSYKYKVKVYSGRWYAMNRLGSVSKKYVDWVAEYNSTCKYDEPYSMWQYTSKGRVPGIEGNVDISYIL